MMDRIIKAVIFDRKARVTFIDTTETVRREIEMHGLSPLSAAALGRAMTAGAYIGTNLKGANSRYNLIINGGGSIGKIEVAGESGNFIRGFVLNPVADLPLNERGKLDVGGAVGTDGYITVIKDYGMKEPYNGRCELVSGEIAEDFAHYLLKSEGINAAVSLGVRLNSSGVLASGGLIIEALPGIDENQLFMLEDILTNFSEISALMCEKSLEDILDFHFGHLNCEILGTEELTLRCSCSKEKCDAAVSQLTIAEAKDLIKEIGCIEVKCEFCNTCYTYDERAAEDLCRKI